MHTRCLNVLAKVVTALTLSFIPHSVHWSATTGFTLVPDTAQAVIGRPLTPISGAGVVRRTTRRHIYRHGAAAAAVVGTSIAVLPAGCGTVYYGGIPYYHCHGSYYRPSGTSYIVVAPPQ